MCPSVNHLLRRQRFLFPRPLITMEVKCYKKRRFCAVTAIDKRTNVTYIKKSGIPVAAFDYSKMKDRLPNAVIEFINISIRGDDFICDIADQCTNNIECLNAREIHFCWRGRSGVVLLAKKFTGRQLHKLFKVCHEGLKVPDLQAEAERVPEIAVVDQEIAAPLASIQNEAIYDAVDIRNEDLSAMQIVDDESIFELEEGDCNIMPFLLNRQGTLMMTNFSASSRDVIEMIRQTIKKADAGRELTTFSFCFAVTDEENVAARFDAFILELGNSREVHTQNEPPEVVTNTSWEEMPLRNVLVQFYGDSGALFVRHDI